MKKMNKKGFTLMEMLIVIAIIAILIAIAIPTFMAQLEKSRKSTDEANARSLKSLAATAYLSGDFDETFKTASSVDVYLSTDGQSYTLTSGDGESYKSNTYGKGTTIKATVSNTGMVDVNCAAIAGSSATAST